MEFLKFWYNPDKMLTVLAYDKWPMNIYYYICNFYKPTVT